MYYKNRQISKNLVGFKLSGSLRIQGHAWEHFLNENSFLKRTFKYVLFYLQIFGKM